MHYAETAFHRASEAMGQPPFDLPSLTEEARVAREKVWLVVVTGERDYEDIAVVRWSGQTVPSGNAVEFAFDQSGVLLMSSASVYRGPAAAFLAPLGIRFAAGRPLPLGPAFQIRHPSPLVQQGHAGIGSCPAWSTEMTATANTSSFSQQQWFVVTLSAENLSKQSCTFVGSGPPARTQEVGPCGPTSLYVLNAEGTVVSPTGTIMCPLLQTVTLGPGRTLRAQGDWGIGVAVPDGRYTVVVAQTFRFSVSVG